MTDNTPNVTSVEPKDEVFTITINKTKIKKYLIIGASCLTAGAAMSYLATKSSEMVDVETDNDGNLEITVDTDKSE